MHEASAPPRRIQLHDSRPILSEMDLVGALAWTRRQGLPGFRARQLYEALWKRGVQSADEMTVLPASLRESLAGEFRVRSLQVRAHLRSKRDAAEKVLFGLGDGTTVETVLIPSGDGRHTVCVSSQVGCPAACTFCATGLSGFARNLTGTEIADQVMYFVHQLRARREQVSNVVFMGMGEPLLNVRAVREAIRRLTDVQGLDMGDRRITLSTVGIVPQIRHLSEWAGQVNLAISLHAPNDILRSSLVPYNQHFPIADIMAAARHHAERTGRRVSFEYVLLRGVNDSIEEAGELATLVGSMGGMAHVNLIPWNPFREGRFVRSEGPNANAFAALLRGRGVNATIRLSKGLDISAACGQLRETLGSRQRDERGAPLLGPG